MRKILFLAVCGNFVGKDDLGLRSLGMRGWRRQKVWSALGGRIDAASLTTFLDMIVRDLSLSEPFHFCE